MNQAISDRTRQHGRAARCPRTRCGARRRSAPSTTFPISGRPLPRAFIRALALIKQAAAQANAELGLLDADAWPQAISAAAARGGRRRARRAVSDRCVPDRLGHQHQHECQRGDRAPGRRACAPGVHPNDHVNMGQSSNDVIPTAIHVSAALLLREQLLPALAHLAAMHRAARGARLGDIVKTGRTHLMDAMPVTLGTGTVGLAHADRERRGPAARGGAAPAAAGAGRHGGRHRHQCRPALSRAAFCRALSQADRHRLRAQPTIISRRCRRRTRRSNCPGQLKVRGRQPDEDRQRPALDEQRPARRPRRDRAAGAAAGQQHHAGQGQSGDSRGRRRWSPPRSSATMRRSRIAGQSGNFQLNVMLPVIAYNLLESIRLLANVSRLLADSAIAGFTVNRAAPGRGARAQSDPGDGAQSGDRLREGRGDRQEGLRRGQGRSARWPRP